MGASCVAATGRWLAAPCCSIGCLQNVRAWQPHIAPARLLDMATRTPATLLGRPDKGRVAVGCEPIWLSWIVT